MTGTPTDLHRIEAELVRRAEAAGPAKGLLGSHAGLIVRSLNPDFRPDAYGVRTLREFIERHVPSLRVIGFSGLDPVYGTSTSPSLAGQSPLRGYELWRVWSSPGAPLAIAVKRETGEARAVPREHTTSADEIQIPPAGFDVHRNIAREFLRTYGSLPDVVSAVLRQTLDDPSGAWWRRWFEALRDFPEVNRAWLEYRRRGLEAALQAALRGSGLEDPQADRACREITTRPAPGVGRPRSRSVTVQGALPPKEGQAELMALVQAVVRRMGDNELRSLPLPVGLVLDVLTRKQAAQ